MFGQVPFEDHIVSKNYFDLTLIFYEYARMHGWWKNIDEGTQNYGMIECNVRSMWVRKVVHFKWLLSRTKYRFHTLTKLNEIKNQVKKLEARLLAAYQISNVSWFETREWFECSLLQFWLSQRDWLKDCITRCDSISKACLFSTLFRGNKPITLLIYHIV